MSRLPGKKVRVEHFKLPSGKYVDFDLRLKENGRFYVSIDGQGYEADSLDELREKLRPVLAARDEVTFRPVIRVSYEKPDDDGWYHHGFLRDCRVAVSLAFDAGYVSNEPIDGDDRRGCYRWQGVKVDDQAAIEPLKLNDSGGRERMYENEVSGLLGFTPERWRTLQQIKGALVDVRARIAALMGDASGAKLDALPVGALLLQAVQAPPAPRKRA